MARCPPDRFLYRRRFPHPRGDGPEIGERLGGDGMISPPAWGWPDGSRPTIDEHEDFPTRVGMARFRPCRYRPRGRFPHPRGDGPLYQSPEVRRMLISPPAWGWPAASIVVLNLRFDFPTRVGMARTACSRSQKNWGFPHPRGDGPLLGFVEEQVGEISPPAWGWPGTVIPTSGMDDDFPTRVGMARRCWDFSDWSV